MKAIDSWNPFQEMEELDRRFNGGRLGEENNSSEPNQWMPRADFATSDDDYYITLDLPGITEDNLKVIVQQGTLKVSALRWEAMPTGVRYRYQNTERLYGHFCRNFEIPKDGIEDKISVDYHHGVLYIRIPRSEEEKPRSIIIADG